MNKPRGTAEGFKYLEKWYEKVKSKLPNEKIAFQLSLDCRDGRCYITAFFDMFVEDQYISGVSCGQDTEETINKAWEAFQKDALKKLKKMFASLNHATNQIECRMPMIEMRGAGT